MMRAIIGFFAGALVVYLAGSFFALDLSWIVDRGGNQAIGRVFILLGGVAGMAAGSQT